MFQNTLNRQLAHHQYNYKVFNSRDDFPPRIFGQLIEFIIERVVKSRNEEALFHIQMFKIFLLMDKGALRFDDVKIFKKRRFEKALVKVSGPRMSAASAVHRVLESVG